MADETKEIIHQHYPNAAAAIAAMNDKNWGYESAANRIIVMDGATPYYFETAPRLISGGSFINNQTASPQSGGFNVSGNGLIGGTLTLTGVQTNSAEIAAGASLAMRRTINTGYIAVSGGNSLTAGANLIMNGGAHATGANDWSFRSGSTDIVVWDDSASLLTVTGGISATTGSFSSTLGVTGNLTLSTLSSGRIPVVSTSGLITQDNLYWDAANDRLGVGSGASSPGVDLQITKSTSGGNVQLTVYNSETANSASHGRILASSGGASGGDGYFVSSNQITDWSMGGDNSDGDAFVITPASTLGGATNGLRISTAGAVTIPGTLGVTGASTLAALSATTGTFSSSVTLNGETANRLLYLNGSKIATTSGNLAWDGSTLSVSGTVGATNLSATTNLSAANLTISAQAVLNGETSFASSLLFDSNTNVGAGGTNWTDEVSVSVAGKNSIALVPTANNQTYKFTSPSNSQMLFVTNASTAYDALIDIYDGTGTTTLYIPFGQSNFMRYNGTRWQVSY